MLEKETKSKAPPAFVTVPPLASGTTAVLSLATETTAALQTIVSHPPAIIAVETTKYPSPTGSLTHELNVSGRTISLKDYVIDVIPGIDDKDDESEKDTGFVRSLGAWSKPLHFTPHPLPLNLPHQGLAFLKR